MFAGIANPVDRKFSHSGGFIQTHSLALKSDGSLVAWGYNGHGECDVRILDNCTLSGNSAAVGRGICHYPPRAPYTFSSDLLKLSQIDLPYRPTVSNCILWEDMADLGPEIAIFSETDFYVSYSNVQGGEASVYLEEGHTLLRWGAGNINVHPCFPEPGYWDPNGTLADANHDFWVNGDYHFKPQAGRLPLNNPRWVKDNSAVIACC